MSLRLLRATFRFLLLNRTIRLSLALTNGQIVFCLAIGVAADVVDDDIKGRNTEKTECSECTLL